MYTAFNPTIVRFKLVNILCKNSKRMTFNPTIVRFKLKAYIETRALRKFTFNPTIVRFKLVLCCVGLLELISFNPTIVRFKPSSLKAITSS